MQPAPQPTVMESLWRMKVRKNIKKATRRQLPREERKRLYLETRPLRRKLLDWVGIKSRALVRTMGTVDAWSGPPVKNPLMTQIPGGNLPLLGSGGAIVKTRLTGRAKWVMTLGMMVSIGGLMGWAVFVEKTRAEGPVMSSEPETRRKKAAGVVEKMERTHGVFVWGSNRFVFHGLTEK